MRSQSLPNTVKGRVYTQYFCTQYWDKRKRLKDIFVQCFLFIFFRFDLYAGQLKRLWKSQKWSFLNHLNICDPIFFHIKFIISCDSWAMFRYFKCTGGRGPRNSRSFYLWIRLLAVQECVPNFKIHGLSLAYSHIFDGIGHKIRRKLVFFSQTVLPRYLRFYNLR
jgi:hypothetical protein